jgi:hypothetical protein
MTTKKIISVFFAVVFITLNFVAQIPMTSVVEHFTNTSCSVCASNNGNIYTVVNNHPGVLHISFHPSSPYSNDYFNQQNMIENDARTEFYGLFGSTPQITLNGLSIPYSTLNTALNSAFSLTSNYQFNIAQTQIAVDSFSVRSVITKIATDNNNIALLFLAATEDTINQTTNNGETIHYNVFRKTITSVTGDSIVLPINIGDSIVNNYGYKSGTAWNVNQMHTNGILQKTTQEVLHSAKSINAISITTGIENNLVTEVKNIFYPNPVISDKLYLKDDVEEIAIYSLLGEKILSASHVKKSESILVNSLPAGVYIIELINGKNSSIQKILKQ